MLSTDALYKVDSAGNNVVIRIDGAGRSGGNLSQHREVLKPLTRNATSFSKSSWLD